MSRTKYLDLLERVGWTAVEAFLGYFIATGGKLTENVWQGAGAAALIATAKCIVAFRVGSTNTAATLPAGPDTDLGGQ